MIAEQVNAPRGSQGVVGVHDDVDLGCYLVVHDRLGVIADNVDTEFLLGGEVRSVPNER